MKIYGITQVNTKPMSVDLHTQHFCLHTGICEMLDFFLQIKKLEDSCYAAEKVYNMETDYKLDKGIEDDVFDDEADNDIGHLVEVDVNNKEKGSEVDTFEGLKQQVSQIQKLSSSIFFISISTYLKY